MIGWKLFSLGRPNPTTSGITRQVKVMSCFLRESNRKLHKSFSAITDSSSSTSNKNCRNNTVLWGLTSGHICPGRHGINNINAQSVSLRSLLAAESREPRSKSPADKNSSGRNLRPTKTPEAEISGQKLLRPKPLESVPQFFPLPLSSPSNKAGWAITVNCSGIFI